LPVAEAKKFAKILCALGTEIANPQKSNEDFWGTENLTDFLGLGNFFIFLRLLNPKD